MSLISRSQTTTRFANNKWNAPRQWKAKTLNEAPIQDKPQKEVNTDLCPETQPQLPSDLTPATLETAELWDALSLPVPQIPDLACEKPNGKPQNGVATGEPCYLLYHNDNEDNNAPDSVKNIRGIFTDLQGNILCKTFPFIPEATPSDDFFANIPENGEWYNNRLFFHAHEGTQLRLWWSPVEERWIISTTRKVDAFGSEWGHKHKKSFGQLAIEALADININFVSCSKGNLLQCDVLNKDKIYCLLLTSEFENRIVCRNVNKKIYSLGCFRRSRNFRWEPTNETQLETPPFMETPITNKNELVQAINKIDPMKEAGIWTMGYDSLQNYCMIKLVNPEYKRLFDLRGNEACHRRRYVDLRNQPQEQKEFAALYSEIDFTVIDAAMTKAAEKIAQLYVEKFCMKQQMPDLGYITRKVLRDMKTWACKVRIIKTEHAMKEINKLSRKELWSLISEQL